MEKLVTDIATNLIIANYFFFLSRISSTTITTRHNPLLTTSGTLAVRTPDSIQPKLPMLTNIFTVIGFLASIPLARKKVAIQPKICDKIYSIHPPFPLVYNKKPPSLVAFLTRVSVILLNNLCIRRYIYIIARNAFHINDNYSSAMIKQILARIQFW